MGKTNKFLLKFAVKVFVKYEKNYNLKTEYSKKINVVGLPTSSQIFFSTFQILQRFIIKSQILKN